MLFQVLGPLAVGGDTAAVTAGRDRVVLAVLLLRAGRVVPVADLVDAMWDADPPSTARAQLQSCVSRLRRLLPADALVTEPGGYRLAVGPGQLDLAEFRRLRAGGDHARALALWRGPALPGIDSRPVRAGAALLDEECLAATEEWAEAALTAGAAESAAAVLAPLVDRHPLRERLRELLMLALAAAGRRAQALDVFRDGRQVLVDELGIEPGPALQALHRRLLDGTSATAAAARALPRAVADFTGRDDAVRHLVKQVEAAPPSTSVVQVIDGMGGAGKTTLAIHVATVVGDRYPDAQLYIDLQGHSEGRPLDPAAALTTLLRQLGVRGELIPPDLDDRVALWRSELANRRALVVLDNAADSRQVLPLLPGNGGANLVLVTSRRRLVGLDGVHPISLPPLTEREALDLLARIVGPARTAAEPRAAAELVRRCGHLALAVRIAGSRLAHRRTWRIADLVERMGDPRRTMAELAAEERSVARAFTLSYDNLPPPAQAMFRAIGRHPGETFDPRAAAALADVSWHDAVESLDLLVDHHLLDEVAPGRFRPHDLLRTFAVVLADDDPAAVERLLDHHLYATLAAGDGMTVSAIDVTDGPGLPARPDLLAGIAGGGEGWIEAERPNLAALIRLAIRSGHHRVAGQLAHAQWRHLYHLGYYDDVVTTQRLAIEAGTAAGDDRALAVAHNYIASAFFRTTRYDEAIDHLTRAIRHRDAAGDRSAPGLAESNLSGVLFLAGRWAQATEYARLALERWRRSGVEQPTGGHVSLCICLAMVGRYDEAMSLARAQLAMATQRRDLVRLANALENLGLLRLRLGQPAMAERLLTAGRRIARRIGSRQAEAEATRLLGEVSLAAGRLAEAEERQRRAVSLMASLSEHSGEARARCGLGRTLLATGRTAEASQEFRAALDAATRLRLPYERGLALSGVADVSAAEGDHAEARRRRREAWLILHDLGAVEAQGVDPR